MVMRQTAKRIANRFCLTALFADELRFIHAHKADKNDLQRLVRLALAGHGAYYKINLKAPPPVAL